jgi:cystathionine beta-lyase/cystathionine gamma-synthase
VGQQNRTSLRVAEYLAAHPLVKNTYYPFLDAHPRAALARKQMSGGGGLLSFEMRGSPQDAQRLVESLQLFSLAASLGGVESLATIPALTSHAMLSQEDKNRTGVTDQLVRLAVGIEHAEDLILDLQQAFDKIAASR